MLVVDVAYILVMSWCARCNNGVWAYSFIMGLNMMEFGIFICACVGVSFALYVTMRWLARVVWGSGVVVETGKKTE